MRENLAGKVVFITGAARGIGAAVARLLARRGARLALAGLEPDLLAGIAHELGPDHAWYECDVTEQAALELAVAASITRFGRLDVVVALRYVLVNPPMDRLVRREAALRLQTLEQEALSLGRSFGAHSAELTRAARR